MNSITSRLTAGAIVATLQMLRSARKEIFLVVEGDDDIALFSQALTLPRSNFVSCFGKERLMEVFEMAPWKGLDCGTIFLRDADFDGMTHTSIGDVELFVSDHCDFEMSLIVGRLFSRIMSEFLKTRAEQKVIERAFDLLLAASAAIGALRKYSHEGSIGLKFKDMDLRFVSKKDMSVNVVQMLQYVFARSKLPIENMPRLIAAIQRIMNEVEPSGLSSGKDFLRLLSFSLSRYYKCCNAGECTEDTLGRMLRISVIQDDIRGMSLYPLLSEHVRKCEFRWSGATL